MAGTELAIADSDVKLWKQGVETAVDVVQKHGAVAISDPKLSPFMQQNMMDMGQRVTSVGPRIAAILDATEDAHPSSKRPPAVSSDVRLTLGWDDSDYSIAGPVEFPEWIKDSSTYKAWQQVQDIKTFYTKDDAGYGYEVYVLGAIKKKDGTTGPFVQTIRRFRPDGTLAASSEWELEGGLQGWETYDATGTRYTMRVIAMRTPREQYTIYFYDADGQEKHWRVNNANTVCGETISDPVGSFIKTNNDIPDYELPVGLRQMKPADAK